jgi:hypothetical protein
LSADDRPRIEQLDGHRELVVHGGEDRERLARRVVEQQEALSARALGLMGGFLRESFDPAAFSLDSIEVRADDSGGDVVLSYSFSPDADPHAYGYTYFDVVFAAREPPSEPFWPIRFTVGFH